MKTIQPLASRSTRLKPLPGSPKTLSQDLRGLLQLRLTREFGTRLPPALVRRAIDEAAELALDAGFPDLFLPELAAEQVRRVHRAIFADESIARLSTAA